MDKVFNSLSKIIQTKIQRPTHQEQKESWQIYYLQNEKELVTTADSCFVEIVKKQIFPYTVNKKALELGFGSGAEAIWLAKKNWNLFAIDFANSAVQRLKKIVQMQRLDIYPFCGDVTSLHPYQRFNKTSFDFVYACYLHLTAKQKKQYIANAYSVLASKGLFLYLGIQNEKDKELFCDEQTIASYFGTNWKIFFQDTVQREVFINNKEKFMSKVVVLITQKI